MLVVVRRLQRPVLMRVWGVQRWLRWWDRDDPEKAAAGPDAVKMREWAQDQGIEVFRDCYLDWVHLAMASSMNA
jgi:hypothetical protein